MDPAKLKVVELRAELSKRGLDSKGNKPVLVERLKQALEEEKAAGGEAPEATRKLLHPYFYFAHFLGCLFCSMVFRSGSYIYVYIAT